MIDILWETTTRSSFLPFCIAGIFFFYLFGATNYPDYMVGTKIETLKSMVSMMIREEGEKNKEWVWIYIAC